MIWFLSQLAYGAACCVGSTSTLPSNVGECEKVTVGVGFSGQSAIGQWNVKSQSTATSWSDSTLKATLGMGARLSPKWTVNALIPVQANTRGESPWSGGVGDASAIVQLDPFTEQPIEPNKMALPTPVFTAGFRAPTGRDWQQSETLTGSDITGLPNTSLLLSARLERTLQDWPYTVGVSTEVQPFEISRVAVSPYVSAGRYIGTAWSILGTLTYRYEAVGEGSSQRTTSSLRVIYGRPLMYRLFAGVDSDVPLPGLGRSQTQYLTASLGAVWVK